jgi:hypothetical protein
MAGLSEINLCATLVLMSRIRLQRITGHKKEEGSCQGLSSSSSV